MYCSQSQQHASGSTTRPAWHANAWLNVTAASPTKPNNCNPQSSTSTQQQLRSKPGKTAQNHTRQFVVHEYHDRAQDPINSQLQQGKCMSLFPVKLHKVLSEVEQCDLHHIISWAPHGRCFMIHKPKAFVDKVMPMYFRQSKLASFQRQLYLYGFKRLTRGKDSGGYYHECFLRGKPRLAYQMERVIVKGTRIKAASNPGQEPNFYALPFVDSKIALRTVGRVTTPLTSASCPTGVKGAHGHQTLQAVNSTSSLNGVFGWYQDFGNSGSALSHGVTKRVLGEDYVDKAMILDFCMDWAPKPWQITSSSDIAVAGNS